MLDSNVEIKMGKAITAMEERFTNVRAGRANPGMLSGINVEYYGVETPLTSLANITVPEARQLFIKPFDKGALKAIEKAIGDANLGINPINNGEFVILTIPELTEDRRKEYAKQVRSMAEDAKVSIRNIRQDANNDLKKQEISEDLEDRLLEEIQNLTNKYNKIIEDLLREKENELMTV